MTTHEQYLSKEKFIELEAELKHLKTVRRKEIAENLEYAKSLGDLSENAEYQDAREAQAKAEDRIMILENLLKHAQIVEDHHSSVVDLGSTVVIKKKGDGESQRWRVVGSEEASVADFKVSNEAPLGAALLGKKKGAKVEVVTPRGKVEYTIVEVE